MNRPQLPALAFALTLGACSLLNPGRDDGRGSGEAPCDAPTRFEVRPTSLTLAPGERRSVEWEIFVLPSGTASPSVDGGSLQPNGTNSVLYVAPVTAGSYTFTVTRDGCPGVSSSIPITVVGLEDPGPAPGEALTGVAATSAAWSTDGARVAFAGVGGVWLFDAGGSFVDSLALPHRGPYVDVAFAPDGQRLAVAGDPGQLAWVIRTEGMVPEARLGRTAPQALVYSADGRRLYLHERDQLATVELSTGAIERLCPLSVPTLGTPRYRLDRGPMDTLIAAAPGELREASTGRQMVRWHDGSFVNAAMIAPDFSWAIIGGALRHPFYRADGELESGGVAVALSSDGTLVAQTTAEPSVIQLLRVTDGAISEERTYRLPNGGSEVLDLAFSPSGAALAVAGTRSSYVLTRAQLGL